MSATLTVLSAKDIAARWGVSVSTIDTMRRTGRMPAPFNADWGRGYRWSLAVIEEYERGQS